jgi:putative transposase
MNCSYLEDLPRPPRIDAADCTHHITSRGNRRQEIFFDDIDRRRFLGLLDGISANLGWRLHAFCLMTNHYHLVVETRQPNLSRGMHRLNGMYARWFNWRHGFDGHVFQGRFHAVLVDNEAHLLELSRYQALNPVRAGLCASPSAWPWGSYRAVAGLAQPPPFLAVDRVLTYFGRDRQRAQQAFRTFVNDAAHSRPPFGPRPGAWHQDVDAGDDLVL